MIARLVAAVALVAAAAGGIAQDRAAEAGDTVRLVLKFVKADAAPPGPVARFVAASCAACAIDPTPDFAADNPRETIVALTVPRARQLELAFAGVAAGVRRVIVESGDVPFRRAGDGVVVQVAPIDRDAVTAGEYALHIVEPGMVLRLEHADPVRRAGAYAAGRFPDVERAAATNLEFAQRAVVRMLGLGMRAERERLGTIQVMGFDTNAPHGHRDDPPHMHMHLRWPLNAGTQIGHFYIGPDGLLTHNVVGTSGRPGPPRTFARGETFTTIGPDARAVYSQRITPEGWLVVGIAGLPGCTIRPLDRGFQSGAHVACPGHAAADIRAVDDLAAGVVTVRTGPITELFRYDRDTGALTAPAAVPPSSPSVYRPPAAGAAPPSP